MTRPLLLALLLLLVAAALPTVVSAQGIDPNTGVWTNVTPANASPGGTFSCSNFGTQSAVVDPDRPSNFYIEYNCQGIWKSTDYGLTWTGPINTGTGGAAAGDCAGGIAIASNGGGTTPPILYEACIRGAGTGFSRSLDGGVSWTAFNIAPAGSRQDVYPPAVDPYDKNHLLLPAHELNALYESTDGGQTWASITFNSGMNENGGTAFSFFINTGAAASTRNTWLYTAQGTGGVVGTWRTANAGGGDGSGWTRVESTEHPHGDDQIYQPDTSGVVYMAGNYSACGFGVVERSADYGQTWTCVLTGQNESTVFGTPNNVYAEYGWACGACAPPNVNANFASAPQPGASGWALQTWPSQMGSGAGEAAVSFNGTQYVVVTSNWESGTWRYAEPLSGPTPTPTNTPLVPNTPTPTPTPTLVPTNTPTATPTSTPIPSGSSVGGLHVVGNQILNGSNLAVKLVGVDKSGAEYMCLSNTSNVFDGPADMNQVTTMKSWAVNIVRLPINEDCWLGINGQPVAYSAATYQSQIVSFVNLLTNNNVAVIIDLQWAAPGTTVSNQLTAMPDADHAPAFWTSVANTFKSNSSVIFDVFNEPFPDNNGDTTAAWQCLRDGGTCPGVSYPAAGTQTLLNAIRATGATNIIHVPGVQFTNSLSQWLTYKPVDTLNPPQIAAEWHSYADQICVTQSGCWDPVVKPVMQQVPLIAGEIGERDCQGVYISPLMSWLDGLGGNYLAWAWDTYDCSNFPALISDYGGTPTGFGVVYRNHLLSLQGIPTPTPVPEVFYSTTFPFGLSLGGTTNYTAADGTVYKPDTPSTALAEDTRFFTPYTTGNTITGTADPTLYQVGRQGGYGNWTINVPNGTYVVTLGVAPTAAYPNPLNAGEFGADQTLQGQKLGTCIWSTYSGTNISPTSGISCPGNVTIAAPPANQVQTATYTVQVFNQMLFIQSAASFGSGRTTMLSTIKVDTQAAPTATPTPTFTPTVGPTPTPTNTPLVTPTPTPTNTLPPTPTSFPTSTAAPTPTPLLVDGFEAGGVVNPPWTAGIQQIGAGSFTVDTSKPRSGQYDLEFARSEFFSSRAGTVISQAINPARSQVFAQAWIAFDAISNDATASHAGHIMGVGSPSGPFGRTEELAYFDAHKGNQLETALRLRDGSWHTLDVQTLTLGPYYGLRIYLDTSGPNPNVTWYVNTGSAPGWVQVDQLTDGTFGSFYPPTQFRIGAWTDLYDIPFGGTQVVRVDDVVLGTAPLP